MRASFFILDPDYLLISPYICPAPTSISSCLKPDSPPTHFFPSPPHLTCHTNKWASWTHLPTVEQVEHYLSDSQVQFLIFLVSFLSLFTFSQSEDMLPPQLLGAGDYIYLFMSSGPSTGLAYSRCAINVCWFYVRSPLWSSECLVVFFFKFFIMKNFQTYSKLRECYTYHSYLAVSKNYPACFISPPSFFWWSILRQLLDIMSFQSYIKYILLKHKDFSYNYIVIIVPNKIQIYYLV